MTIDKNYVHFRWKWFCLTITVRIKHAAITVTDQTTRNSLSRWQLPRIICIFHSMDWLQIRLHGRTGRYGL